MVLCIIISDCVFASIKLGLLVLLNTGKEQSLSCTMQCQCVHFCYYIIYYIPLLLVDALMNITFVLVCSFFVFFLYI